MYVQNIFNFFKDAIKDIIFSKSVIVKNKIKY